MSSASQLLFAVAAWSLSLLVGVFDPTNPASWVAAAIGGSELSFVVVAYHKGWVYSGSSYDKLVAAYEVQLQTARDGAQATREHYEREVGELRRSLDESRKEAERVTTEAGASSDRRVAAAEALAERWAQTQERRAERAESENAMLRQAMIERVVPALTQATQATQQALALMGGAPSTPIHREGP